MRASVVLLSLLFVTIALPGMAAARPDVIIPYSCNVTWTDIGELSAPGTPYDGQQVWVPTKVQCYG